MRKSKTKIFTQKSVSDLGSKLEGRKSPTNCMYQDLVAARPPIQLVVARSLSAHLSLRDRLPPPSVQDAGFCPPPSLPTHWAGSADAKAHAGKRGNKQARF